MKTLIGFNGKAGAGKDTAAAFLKEMINYPTYALATPLKEIASNIFGFDDRHLNGELKEVVSTFSSTNFKSLLLTPLKSHARELIPDHLTDEDICNYFYREVALPHLIGENEPTESVTLRASPRQILQKIGTDFAKKHIHRDLWIKIAEQRFQEQGSLIITDVRFDEEAEWIKSFNGYIIEIVTSENKKVSNHVSENGISRDLIDVSVQNDRKAGENTLPQLREAMKLIVELKLQAPVINSQNFV